MRVYPARVTDGTVSLQTLTSEAEESTRFSAVSQTWNLTNQSETLTVTGSKHIRKSSIMAKRQWMGHGRLLLGLLKRPCPHFQCHEDRGVVPVAYVEVGR